MEETGYKFISYPYSSPFGDSSEPSVTFSVPQEASRYEMLEIFQRFMVASGYYVDSCEVLDFVERGE